MVVFSVGQVYGVLYGAGATVLRENVRFREYVPSCNRATATYTGKEDSTLQQCGMAPAKVLILETREPGQVSWRVPLFRTSHTPVDVTTVRSSVAVRSGRSSSPTRWSCE